MDGSTLPVAERGPMLPGFWPFDGLEPGAYNLILADPPWQFSNWSTAGERKNPNQHYACMSMKALRELPVLELAAEHCALVCWCTSPLLDQAIDLMKGWGFSYRACGTWAKQSKTGRSWGFGGGYIFRSAAEYFVLAVRGHPKPLVHTMRNLVVAPLREHSRKPDQFRDDLRQLYGGRACELFARSRADGWEAWGNEVGKF